MGKLKRPLRKRVLIAVSAVGVLIAVAGGTTLAWLGAQSATLSNTFGTAKITCDVDETFSDGIKSDVSIHNTGTMDAYIRVALIPVWKDGDSIAGTAATLADCTMDWGDVFGTTWVRGADGFYYCKIPIAAGANTPILIDECTAGMQDGYRFELQISAQAIQALPTTAVAGEWGPTVTSVQPNGTLEVLG